MMMLPNTIQELSKHAAQEFIQTAVFVDDRIYERSSAKSSEGPSKLITPKPRRKAIKNVSVGAKTNVTPPEIAEEDSSPDSYDIVTSFAKKQIICCLYQPKSKAKVSPTSDIFPLCKSADVVILDWDLFGDKGKRALELVDGLVAQAVQDVPEQLRLILVYTQETNLFSVANELYEKVHASIGDEFQPLEGGLTFHTSNSRITVLGKPGRERADTNPEHIVHEKDIADAAVIEFAKLASGLLQAATLLGLSEIRKNSRKILSKFNTSLDPAFITHMAMCLPDEDASSHVTPLLVSEIESVLEDVLPSPLISSKLLADWCNNVWKPGAHLSRIFNNANVDYKSVAIEICSKGFKQAAKDNSLVPNINKSGSKHVNKAAKIFLPNDASEANHSFSQLMASRTFYGNGKRTLQLGCIVRNQVNGHYLLCIQPVCDSVRLKDARSFIFVKMSEISTVADSTPSHFVASQGTA
ncbi:hypothetical protein FKV24_010790, partial [Lysobacter maris]